MPKTTRKSYEIDGDEHTYVIVTTWRYEPGEYLELNHPLNGYGKGWYIEDIQVENELGQYVTDQFTIDQLEKMEEHVFKETDPSEL